MTTKSITFQAAGQSITVQAEKIDNGEIIRHDGKDIRIGQCWKITHEGRTLGHVTRDITHRERGSRNAATVFSRSESPAWLYTQGEKRFGISSEVSSVARAAETLYRSSNA